MSRFVSPGDSPGSKGISPEEDPRYPNSGTRTFGFLSIAFGIALGITFILFFSLLPSIVPGGVFKDFAVQLHLSWWQSFVIGFTTGMFLSVVYNMLVVRRLNLFGLESLSD